MFTQFPFEKIHPEKPVRAAGFFHGISIKHPNSLQEMCHPFIIIP
jgi:hypothetical protein